jgi:Tfp pilus assembly protein PilF
LANKTGFLYVKPDWNLVMRRFVLMNTLLLVLAGICTGCSNFPGRDMSATSQSNGLYAPDVVELGEAPLPSNTQDLAEQRTNLQITKAQLAVEDGQPHVAKEILESILESDPQNAEAAHLLGVLHTQSGDLEAAEHCFKIALATQGRQAEFNCDYGYFCYLVGRWDEAQQHLARAIELNPHLAKAQTNLGMLEARLGQAESARKRFQKAGCSDAEVLNNMAFAQLLQHDFTGAESTYVRALERNPDISAGKNGRQLASYLSKAVANESAESAKGEIPSKSLDLPRSLNP